MKMRSISEVAREIICGFLNGGHDVQKLALARNLRRLGREINELLGELQSLK
jgi:hypothetical protein